MSPGTSAHAPPRFDAEYVPLRADRPLLGEVSVLPWDTEIFGFRIGEYRPGEPGELAKGFSVMGEELARWASTNDVELIGCRVPSIAMQQVALLEETGFRFIELQMRATLPRLQAVVLAACRLSIRAAEVADSSEVARIAGSAFAFGRYHADPAFPREHADRRYRVWMERALERASPGTWIAVAGPPGQVSGFLHAEVEGDVADIRLMASDFEKASLAGPELLLGALHELRGRGVQRVIARLSPANSAALNLYASLGFRFHEPEIVLHWHRPGAPHLRPLAPAIEKGSHGTGRAS